MTAVVDTSPEASRSSTRATTAPAAALPALPALPAWPVLLILWGYPVFWATGLLAFSTPLVALPMLAFLVMRRRIVLVPGLLPFIGFVIWMLPCMLMVDQLGQMLSIGIRWTQFVSIAIIMVYIVNARESLTPQRLLRGLTFIWCFIIVGGYLGMFFPEGQLTWTIGRFIPGSLLENEYVAELAFPGFAEIQTPWGAEEPFVRPSAPFAYTNGWGAAIAILTPIVVGRVVSERTARSAWWLALAVVAAVPPAVATTNRGLFLGLAIGIGYVLIRLALRGHWLPFIWVSLLSVAVGVMLTWSGLLESVAERQETVDTTDGRSNVYLETFQRTLESPVLGFGAPRPGLTTEVYVGTQGAVWNAMFCFGFVGLILFMAFLVGAALRTWEAPNVAALWVQASVVVAVVLAFFYGLDRHLLFVGIAAAMMLREKSLGGSTWWTRAPIPFWRLRHEA
jgi:hypothetical protein